MTLPGLGGTLLPGRFAAAPQTRRRLGQLVAARSAVKAPELMRWWSHVARTCGPATGVRTLHDRIGVPIFRMLGFQVGQVAFDGTAGSAKLETPGGVRVGLVERPWSDRPPTLWRDAATAAREAGGRWCFVLAPPHLSLVDARGHARRRSIDVTWPAALDDASLAVFARLLSAAAFDGDPAPIETLLREAQQFEARVGRDLQGGVLRTLDDLPGVLERGPHAAGTAAFDETLTVVYRVLFLLFAESRQLVPAGHPVYRRAYSIGQLCRDALAGESRGLWEALAAVTRLSRAGCDVDDLIVAPFNGRLFARATAPSLERRSARHDDPRSTALGRALVELGTRPGPGGREAISYADLGVEELGAVYERVLDLEPGRRKQTGTFYTPQPLAAFVVRRTLAPLVAGRTSDEILTLRVVDPAMGSGAFLVAACRFLAEAYEHALIEEGRLASHEVTDEDRAAFRRLIAERCLSGVDVNPTAVQLARLSLWLTTLSQGRPLSFLDHQLRVGNSLIGAMPDDLTRPAGGRRRKLDRGLPLFDEQTIATAMRSVARPLREIREAGSETVRAVHEKEARWARLSGERSPLAAWRLAASLWCACWLWRDGDERADLEAPAPAELRAALDAVLHGDVTVPVRRLDAWLGHAGRLARRLAFFHWPLEFADAFYEATGEPRTSPGFDAVIGNPPWEMLRRESDRIVAGVPSAHGMLRFVRDTGLYPSCGSGHLNLYQPFVDRSLDLTRPGGRVGLVLPWSVATDDGARDLRRRLLDENATDVVVGLENARGLFPIHRGLRFAVVTARRGGSTGALRVRLGVTTAEALDELPGRDEDAAEGALAFPVHIDRRTRARVGGSTGRIPDARSPADLEWLDALCRRHPRLGDPNGWNLRFGRELNATDDRASFGRSGLPVLDGKHIAPFVVDATVSSRRIARAHAERLLPDRRFDRARLAYRDVSGVGNRRCLIAAVVPAGVVTTHTLFCLRTPLDDERQHFLCAMLNSDALDAVARMWMGSHITTSLVLDLPVPVWRGTMAQRTIAALAARLASPGGGPRRRRLHARIQARTAALFGVPAPAA